MTDFQLSAYDPAFWLHHANIDRLTAIWQALNPTEYVKPTINVDGTYYQPRNGLDTQDSPLAPFHADETGTMWTAATVRDTFTFGYTYPELIDWNVSAAQLTLDVRQKVNALYNPMIPSTKNESRRAKHRRSSNVAQRMSDVHGDTALLLGVNNLDIQYYLRVQLTKEAAGNNPAIYFFVGGVPTEDGMWSRAANLIGSLTPLVGGGGSKSAIQTDIPCTHTVAAAVDRGLLTSMQFDMVVPFLRENVAARIKTQAGVDDAFLHGVRISVVSRNVQPRKLPSEFPSYGSFQEHYIITSIL